MSKLNLDLLRDFDAGTASAGMPLKLSLDLVHEDPNQPRKAFDAAALGELSESVRVSGIKSPISVRAHPTLSGHYMLNFGARRLRAARAAGLETIPAFLDEAHSDYEQVVENLQRDNLTPMEMAQFINGKLKGGDTATEVARRLGIDKAAVSKYGALIDAPEAVEAVYREGRCTSPSTLYDLRNAYGRWPDEVSAWLRTGVEVSRGSVSALRKRLSDANFLDVSAQTEEADPGSMSTSGGPGAVHGVGGSVRPVHRTVLKRRTAMLRVAVSGREAMLRLDRWPSSPERVVVQFADGGIEEVDAGAIRVLGVTEV
ncbi:ParB/RepB/Spo0J family partition protein [Asticcacaulis sp. W401b]|uniref:ParB/RepB/Spo0J family partition protein n=1 Tax=Asticcacaulis sp. W401b TaxID=3388666 RepID=UPI00397050A8